VLTRVSWQCWQVEVTRARPALWMVAALITSEVLETVRALQAGQGL
jgi:hypothetical protein